MSNAKDYNDKNFETPGPIYEIPTLFGAKGHSFSSVHPKAPSYTFRRKFDLYTKPRSPGPAAYNSDSKINYRGLDFVPKYSMGKLINEYASKATPGPSDYNITSAQSVIWPRAPSYLITHSRSQLITNKNPAPNAYKLPSPDLTGDVPASPKYTIGQLRCTDKISDGPGPGHYTLGAMSSYLPTIPKFSMGPMARTPSQKLITPSPAHYKHELVTAHLPSSPSFSFGYIRDKSKGENNFDKTKMR